MKTLAWTVAVFLMIAGTFKVVNEFRMTQAYNSQAYEQQRVANILEAEKDLKAVEFTSKMNCTVTRARELVEGDCKGDFQFSSGSGKCFKRGAIKTSVTCGD